MRCVALLCNKLLQSLKETRGVVQLSDLRFVYSLRVKIFRQSHEFARLATAQLPKWVQKD